MPSVSCREVVSALPTASAPVASSNAATSVNVPPMSAASRRPKRLTLLEGDPGAAGRAHVVAAGTDQSVVIGLLHDVGRPARDAAGRDHRREEIDRDPERVEE